MGNCCGKESDNFHGEGRALGSQPSDSPARPVGQQNQAKISAPRVGRTLGSASQGDAVSPREAAARAAEERANAHGQNQGKLGQKLNQQKQQSQNATLAQNARDNIAARDADAAAQARNYN